MVDASERLQVLLSQEARVYGTTDYMARLQRKQEEEAKPAADMAWEAYHSTHPSSSGSASASSSASSPKKRKSWDEDEVEEEARGPAVHDGRVKNGGSTAAAPGGTDGNSTTSTLINKHWREKICEWAYQVVDHFDLNREVVSIAMNLLDRYLGSYDAPVDKNLFQLLAMTCLYMSIKLNEYKHLLIPGSKSSMDTILQLSRGFFTLEEMEKMEFDILQHLGWYVHPPTSQLFVKHFLFFLSIEHHEIHDVAQFMVELSIMDYFFVSYKPSEVAMASLLNAMDRLYPPGTAERIQFPFQSEFLDPASPGVQACRARLALIYAQANDQSGNIASPTTERPARVSSEPGFEHRTTSPVSVMTPPPSSVTTSKSDCSMETDTYSSWHA